MSEEERKIVPRPDNKYCPSCGAIYQEGEKFCSQCGNSLEEKPKPKPKEETDVAKVDIGDKKIKRKKAIIITIIVIIALFLISGGVYAWYYYSQKANINKQFENKINSMWTEIISKNNKFDDDLQTVASEKDMSELSDEALEIDKLAKNKITELDNLETPKSYDNSKTKFKAFLEKYADYMVKLRSNILDKNIANINVNKDFNESQRYADYAKDAKNSFVNASNYLKGSFNDSVFNLNNLKSYVEKWQGNAANQASQKAKEEEEAKKAAEKQAVEQTVTGFMNGLPSAYGATDKWADAQRIADKYWYTPSMGNFRSDYKVYFDGTPGGLTYLGGQIIKSERVSDTKFDVSSEEREKYTTPDHENKFLSYFIVEKFGSSWFINSHGRK